jgi:ABC-type branched-subunit amino acid transport system ATPase component/branched-subunit amino acid ABC-type transport system permease component
MGVVGQFLVYALLSLPLVGAYAMLAAGIVVIFRASKVLNLAHGAMAMVPAYVAYALVQAGLPVPVALVLGVLSGALLGAFVERVFVRPLAAQGPTAQTVGTVAVYGLAVALSAQIFGSGSRVAVHVFPDGGVRVSGSLLRWGQLGLFATALVSVFGCFALLRFTRVGLSMRGAAENPTAAGLMGIDADRMARLAWLLGGGLAGLAGIELAADTTLNTYSLSLQMLPAFVAALIGGLGSLPGALVGAVVVGLAQGLVPAFTLVPGLRHFASQVGLPELVVTLLALGVLSVRGQRIVMSGPASGTLARVQATHRRQSSYDTSLSAPRGGRVRAGRFVLLAALVAWPFASFPGFLPVDRFSLLGDAILAGEYFLVAASIVMLTGWVGQISLAQATFAGMGAFGSALVGRHIGLPFPAGLLVGAAFGAAVSLFVGVVALRVRGLYLAVATLILAWMADDYLFVVPWFAGTGGTADLTIPTVGHTSGFPFVDLTERRTFYFVVLAVAAAVMFGLLNLRDSKTGRAFAAIRGSEGAAASLGVNVTRTKLLAFTVSGAIAGLAGNLILTHQSTVVPEQFSLRASLLFLAIAVVGGLNSLGGAVGASVLFAGLSELFFRVPALGSYLQLVSAVLLAAVLLLYPGGLAAVPDMVGRWRARFARTDDEATTKPAGPEMPRQRDEPDPVLTLGSEPREGIALEARDITVRFGGLTAVDGVSLRVETGQIVGLIGPNGAGKTTLFNAVSGLNTPTTGQVLLYGEDVTALPVHERAARGLGRTFQVIQLFPELSVFENLLVATHLHNRSGMAGNIVVTGRSVRAELAAERLCREVVRFLGMQDIADRAVAGLPFGTLRMIELGRALVMRAPLVMLDEPASGLDHRETDALSAVLLRLRDELGLAILLIEHDVRMVTGVSDQMYVVDRGRLISEGSPSVVQADPAVHRAYLGEPEAVPV